MSIGWVPAWSVLLGAVAALLLRPRGLLAEARRAKEALSGRGPLLIAVGLAAIAFPVAAYRYVDVTDYAVNLAASTLAFVALYVLLLRFEGVARAVCRSLLRVPVPALAIVFTVAAAAAGLLVLDGVPHISDAVAYQLQAKAIAAGGISLAAPEHPEFFGFTHTLVDGTRWYGIMNPGWPAILAVGYLAGAPWVVNPLLGGLTLIVLHAFFRRAGFVGVESRLAVALLAVSPFMLFMSASYMSHAASLAVFAFFLLFWARLLTDAGSLDAVGAGLALAAGILIRPVDAVAVAAPFGIHLAFRAFRNRRYAMPLGIVGLLGMAGVGLTLAYNRHLTGDPLLFPVTKYFELRNPAERFGLGFGADMGTSIHGSEWPGFYPLDAVKVTSYRIIRFLDDLHAVPLVLLAALGLGLSRLRRDWPRWHGLLLVSALALAGVYFFHFYNGIAYGSRHYFLALPAVAVLLARPIASVLGRGAESGAAMGRAAFGALVLSSLLVAYPPLVREYGDRYRGASGWVRDAVRDRGIHDALVFVEPGDWSWKSAFPLNEIPIGSGDVVYAKDLGDHNAVLLAAFPDRAAYRIGESDSGEVIIVRLRP